MGKSELALWCAVKMALGEDPWTGQAVEPIEVAYFDFEMTLDDLDDRLSAFGVDPLRLSRLHYAIFPRLAPLDTELGGLLLEEAVTEVGAQAVVIDTFTRAVNGQENDADTVRAFYRFTGSLLKAKGIGYLRTDHSGKDAARGQRGTSAKRDDVDVVWSQRRSKDGIVLDCSGSSRLSWVKPLLAVDRHENEEGLVTYSRPVQLGLSGPAVIKAREMDAANVPLDCSRRNLRDYGITGRNEVLLDALRYRREQGRKSGPRGGDHSIGDSAGDHAGDQSDDPGIWADSPGLLAGDQ
jgi:hypothetical protein